MISLYKKLKKAQDEMDKLGNKLVRIKKQSYSGKGRPKKSDYALVKIKDIREFEAAEILNNGSSTEYIK